MCKRNEERFSDKDIPYSYATPWEHRMKSLSIRFLCQAQMYEKKAFYTKSDEEILIAIMLLLFSVRLLWHD